MIYHGDGVAAAAWVLIHKWAAVCLCTASCLSMAACSGGSGARTSHASAAAQRIPALSFAASPAVVESGDFATLSWSASDAAGCEASGGWSGARGASGSQRVGPIQNDTVFRLSCSGDGGGVSKELTVTLDSGNPSVVLEAQPAQIMENQATTLTWSSSGVSKCTASGGWGGARASSGSFHTPALAQATTYTLSCTGPSGNALASVTVDVLSKVLRWQAPTSNVDGSALTDLAGYNVYWGTESGAYGTPQTIRDPKVTQWRADMPPGTYYFALTAFDTSGAESAYSNEVMKIIP